MIDDAVYIASEEFRVIEVVDTVSTGVTEFFLVLEMP